MEASATMAAFCFHVVAAELRKQAPPLPFPGVPSDQEAAVFVSFKKTHNNELRGCIGTFTAKPIAEQLRTYARAAAFEDSRFSPIRTMEELATLSCTVSLLHSFEPVARWDDWTVGHHGVQISFRDGATGDTFRSTFLPRVSKEQCWDQRTTMRQLVRKAGYRGTVDDDLLCTLRVTRYQETTASATFAEAFPGDDLAAAGDRNSKKGEPVRSGFLSWLR